METIKKHIGEGFGKGELYAALAYDASDAFGGMKIKALMLNSTGRISFRDANAYIYSSVTTQLDIVATTIALDGAVTMDGVTSGNVLYMHYDNICTDGLHLRCIASHAVIYINPRGTVEVDYPILVNIADGVTTAAGIYILNYKVGSPIGIKIATGGSGTITDGIMLQSKTTAAGIVNGIRFEAYSVGSITYALSFKGVTGISGAKVGAVCNTNGVDSDAAVKIDIDGTPYFIPAFTAGNTTGSW